MGERKQICLSCGDNAAKEDSVTCEECTKAMFVGGYRGDGL